MTKRRLAALAAVPVLLVTGFFAPRIASSNSPTSITTVLSATVTYTVPTVTETETVTVSASTSSATTSTTSTTTSTTANSPTMAFGFTVGAGPDTVTNWTTAQRSVYYDTALAAGATTLRMDYFSDSNVPAIQEARAKGLDVLVIVQGNNADTPAAYAARCSTAVARFAPVGVHEYEVRNEPNINGMPPIAYGAQAKACAAVVHTAQPGSTVVVGALSNYGVYPQEDSTHQNPVLFLDRMLASTGVGWYDAISYHPYGFCNSCTAEAAMANLAGWAQIATQSPSLVSTLAKYGSDAKVWIDEHGAPTDGGAYTGGMSESEQARLVTLSIAAFKAAPWAGQFFWYSLKDRPTFTDREGHFGLQRADGSFKPGYAAFILAAK